MVACILEQIIGEYQPKLTADLLDFVLFKNPERKWSGLAQMYPADCSTLPIRLYIQRKLLTVNRLNALKKLNIVVRDSDIILALESVEDMGTENILVWYQLVDYRLVN